MPESTAHTRRTRHSRPRGSPRRPSSSGPAEPTAAQNTQHNSPTQNFRGVRYDAHADPTGSDTHTNATGYEARINARKQATKREMNREDHAYFDHVHELYKLWLADFAVKRNVTVEMIERYWGSTTVLRAANGWQEFQKEEINRAEHRGPQSGVGKKAGNTKIAERWNALTPAEKAVYHERAKMRNERAMDSNSFPTTEASQLTRSKRISNSKTRAEVREWVTKWVVQANNVARRCGVEFILVGASKNLGPHHFQIFRGTTGVQPFITEHMRDEKSDYFPGMFQAFVVSSEKPITRGKVPHETLSRSDRKSELNEKRSEIRSKLNEIVQKASGNRMKIWPWANMDLRLEKKGLKLALDPQAVTDCGLLTRGSGYLKWEACLEMLEDIGHGFIKIVHDNGPTRQSGKQPAVQGARKAKRMKTSHRTDPSSSNESEEDSLEDHLSDENE